MPCEMNAETNVLALDKEIIGKCCVEVDGETQCSGHCPPAGCYSGR